MGKWSRVQENKEKANHLMLEMEQQLHGALIYDSRYRTSMKSWHTSSFHHT